MKRFLLSALFVVPFDSTEWQLLEYSGIPANKASFVKSEMSLKIEKSASPIIYPLPQKKKVSKIRVSGEISGLVELGEKEQGEKGADDYVLRVGLVVSGEQTLSGPRSWFAPSWIKKLFSLAKKGEGVDHIYFLNIGQNASHQGRIRNHPLSELMKEEVILVKNETGSFSFEKEFASPIETAALWIASDGDDTGSSFSLKIKKIELLSP